ncbi:het domain protein [Pyrenophora tritici-repentis]|nr:het domain protein [Pyrenophora tritici-repentis]
MSWAAGRQTTRVEDEAYSLLGIFDVNMPLLYGKGDKACRRLQEEIIKSSVDPSIFAWTASPTPVDNIVPGFQNHCGILARSPAAFIFAGLLLPSDAGQPPKEFTMTNKGLKTGSLLLYSGPFGSWSGYYYILPLACLNMKGRAIGVQLQMLSQNTFVRKSPFDLFRYDTAYNRCETSDCYILIGHPPAENTISGQAKKL